LSDPQKPPPPLPSAEHLLVLQRNAQIFANRADLAEQLKDIRTVVDLAPEELLHPAEPAELVVRRGKLRISQLLPDGREVTRAVLQAGGVLTIVPVDSNGENPADDLYSLPDLILMALGEVRLWRLPPGSLD
jgi:CRP-like cAMP-binding protein